MQFEYRYIPYEKTGKFSRLATDYVNEVAALNPFISFSANKEGIAKAIEARKKYPVDRVTLVEVLHQQYSGIALETEVKTNIELLKSENTFSICTAHQPNLATGYLYFIYKILHAIRMAEELKKIHTTLNFVPIYYMGSEDADLDELGTFNFRGETFTWDGAGQTGAVGRMSTQGIEKLLSKLFKIMGPPGKQCDELIEMLVNAYQKQKTIGRATIQLVNELFGKYGLVIVDPDHAALKRQFIPAIKDELLNRSSFDIVSKHAAELEKVYHIQAPPRPLNLFYLFEDRRDRIEYLGNDEWQVVNTNLFWDKTTLMQLVEQHPERFSPNVILRGVFQETVLPNIVFIGGGAEVAYWLELKTLFEHHKTFYPVIFLRQSVTFCTPKTSSQLAKIEVDFEDLFLSKHTLETKIVNAIKEENADTTPEMNALRDAVDMLKQKIGKINPQLEISTNVMEQKMKHLIANMEKKITRHEKKKHADRLEAVTTVQSHIFPKGSLQERYENFTEYYSEFGNTFIDGIARGILPFNNTFLLITCK